MPYLKQKWVEFLELGDSISNVQLQDRVRTIAPNKCATLIYTVIKCQKQKMTKYLLSKRKKVKIIFKEWHNGQSKSSHAESRQHNLQRTIQY
jgi:hypothetical protein